jgi:hypothetical protein
VAISIPVWATAIGDPKRGVATSHGAGNRCACQRGTQVAILCESLRQMEHATSLLDLASHRPDGPVTFESAATCVAST